MRDTSILSPVPIRPPTGVTTFRTSQAQETIHQPTWSGPSTTTRVILAGVGAGIQAGGQAYVQGSMMRDQWTGLARGTRQRAHPVTAAASDTGSATSYSNNTPDVNDVSIGQDQQVADAANASASATFEALSGEVVADEVTPNAQVVVRPRYQGALEVRFEDRGFEMGSGATERANPLNGDSIENDLGVELFNNGRRSNWLPVGSAVGWHMMSQQTQTYHAQDDCLNLPDDPSDERVLAEFEHRQFGGSGSTVMHVRNRHTGRQHTIDVPLDGSYLLTGQKVPPGAPFIATGTRQKLTVSCMCH